MSATALLARLGVATLLFTVLAGGLMLARRPLRLRLGAEAAYALWLLVPLGVGLCCWPVHRQTVRMEMAAVAADPGMPAVLEAAPSAGPQLAMLLVCAWLAGAGAGALLLCLKQRAFLRALGALRRVDEDSWIAARTGAGPMLVGLLRPRIVLPADYATRYTAQEQAAVLAHERMHRRRGDLWWNALCAALRCVFWFHPLASGAQRAFLADQELACDSAVLRSRAHAPHTYAEALLKTQTGTAAPLGCAMGAASPLRERILNLGRRGSPPRVRVLAALLLAAFAAAGGHLAWAASAEVVPVFAVPPAIQQHTSPTLKGSTMTDRFKTALPLGLAALVAGAGVQAQPASPPTSYGVSMDIGIHGEQAAPRVLVKEKEPFAVAGEHAGKPWRVEFTIDRTPGRMVRLTGRILEDGKTIAAPVLVGPLGERVGVKVGDDVLVALVVQENTH